jgi:nicotinate-nucleotide adenylyltransferase
MGHLVAASEAVDALGLDCVLFVPAGRPWQKQSYSDAEDRYAMTVLAAAAHERFAVSRMEIDRPGPTYTADTAEALRGFYGDAALFFLVGADVLAAIDSWRGLDRLASCAEVVGVSRAGESIDYAGAPAGLRVRFIDIPMVDVSSTDVRRRVRAGRSIRFLVPDDVAAYIADHGLYLDAPEGKDA